MAHHLEVAVLDSHLMPLLDGGDFGGGEEGAVGLVAARVGEVVAEVTDEEVVFPLAGIRAGAATHHAALKLHVILLGGVVVVALVAQAVNINVGVARDGGAAEGAAAEGTPVATCPHMALDDELALVEVHARGCHRIMVVVGGFLDGLQADEGIH